jgi:hypothetical protein
MKSDPFADAVAQQTTQRDKSPRQQDQRGKHAGKPNQSKQPSKPQQKEMTMEEKLALLVNKFKK